MESADVIVIGGGVTGAAIALGLVESGAEKVIIFDEQLPSQRLSRGNFGLTWFMCKGANNPVYAQWCRMATNAWPELSSKLKAETGYDIELEWTGGALHIFGDEMWRQYEENVQGIRKSCEKAGLDYPVQMLDRQQFQDLIPKMKLGPDCTGAMYAADQGHINPLLLLAALRASFIQKGGVYKSRHLVEAILPEDNGTVSLRTSQGGFNCNKLVVAAGHGTNKLVASLGEKIHTYPSRGQLMVSERRERVLNIPLLCCRQTPDGTFIIGLSTEDIGLDCSTTVAALQSQAANAVRLFPDLNHVNWVRSWGAVRVMTPDGAPIYTQLKNHENITVLALHSAVSLAPLHVHNVASWILGQSEPDHISHFNNSRFNV